MTSDAARWFELFAGFSKAPSSDSYAAVFHPEGEATIEVPDQRRALMPVDLTGHLSGMPLSAVDWAGDGKLAFVEWRRDDLLGVDRLELKDSRIQSMRRYFDRLGLLAERDPPVAALRASLLSNTR
jgi:hypothetical protein